MRRLYWRPAGASRRSLSVLALLSIACLVIVQLGQTRILRQDYERKLGAARRASAAFEVIRGERVRRGHPLDRRTDPAMSGMIGMQATPVTTSAGDLTAKQTSANPNFAAVVVQYMTRLGLEEGDIVAVGCSGSFPSLNIAVLAALETLDLQPIVVSSAAASDWGANIPDLMWLDMERTLADGGVFGGVSLAASIGGIEDQGLGLSEEGRRMVTDSIERNGVQLLTTVSFEDGIAERMELYDAAADGHAIKAYINVGGGAVSTGRHEGKSTYSPGINRPLLKAPVDSVIGRFLDRGVPVVHLVQIVDLAERYGLPIAPMVTPAPGEGAIFQRTEPNRWLVGALLLVMGGAILFVGRRSRARAHLRTAPPAGSTP